MSNKFLLFDLPTRDPKHTWSLNPWKTRLGLNFKGANYATEWVEYPDIKNRLKDHVGPLAGSEASYGQPTWTIPTLRFPDNSYLNDSRVIATALDKAIPTPSFHLDAPVLAKLEALNSSIVMGLVGVFIPGIPRDYLSEKSIPYWKETRMRTFGMTPEEMGRVKGPGAWEGVKEDILKVEKLFKETEGRFFLGDTPSYADFVWVATLLFFKGMTGAWEGLKGVAGDFSVHEELLEACKEWIERDSY